MFMTLMDLMDIIEHQHQHHFKHMFDDCCSFVIFRLCLRNHICQTNVPYRFCGCVIELLAFDSPVSSSTEETPVMLLGIQKRGYEIREQSHESFILTSQERKNISN